MRQAGEDIAVRPRAGRGAGGRDAHFPLEGRGLRCEAEAVVAGLVAKAAGNHQFALGCIIGDRQFGARHELVIEDRQGLGLASLREIGWRRVDQVTDRHAGRRLDGQHGRDQRRIARCIRLHVQAGRQLHGQRHSRRRPDGHDGRRGVRGDVCLRPPHLCGRRRADAGHDEQQQDGAGAPPRTWPSWWNRYCGERHLSIVSMLRESAVGRRRVDQPL